MKISSHHDRQQSMTSMMMLMNSRLNKAVNLSDAIFMFIAHDLGAFFPRPRRSHQSYFSRDV